MPDPTPFVPPFDFGVLPSKAIVFSLVLNAVQLLAAVVIIALVGANYDATVGDHSDAVYTFVVSVLSLGVSSMLVRFVFVPPRTKVVVVLLVLGQWVLVVLWAAALGVLGSRYLEVEGKGGLRTAMGWVCAELVVWSVGAILGGWRLCYAGKGRARKARKNVSMNTIVEEDL